MTTFFSFINDDWIRREQEMNMNEWMNEWIEQENKILLETLAR